jgi:hypothetical protein
MVTAVNSSRVLRAPQGCSRRLVQGSKHLRANLPQEGACSPRRRPPDEGSRALGLRPWSPKKRSEAAAISARALGLLWQNDLPEFRITSTR